MEPWQKWFESWLIENHIYPDEVTYFEKQLAEAAFEAGENLEASKYI